mmetsp:Transcript_70682/g.160537  ORF Transcript_70682/g.160537 Transcript_70682/m.160537 type:complete len:215 (+) Transcript_70682:946-1590(+)
MVEKFGVRPIGVDMFAMPGVPNGVWPGVNIWMPPKGVAPGVAEGDIPLAPGVDPVGVALGVTSVGVASAVGVALGPTDSTGVSSQRARLRLGAPGVGVSPHCPGVGVSPRSSSLAPGVSSHLPLGLSSSSSSTIGVSAPSPPTGVSHLSPLSSSFLPLSLSFPVFESQRRFFFSTGASSAPPSAFGPSSSRCFWIFRKSSCFSLSSCWLIITSL